MRKTRRGISALLALMMIFSMLSFSLAEEDAAAAAQEAVEATAETAEEAAAVAQEAVETAAETVEESPALRAARELFGEDAVIYAHDSQLTLALGSCVDHPLADMDAAGEAMEKVAAALTGGEEELQFIPWRTLMDPAGNRYYTFQQISGGVTVCGGALKIITDPEDRMIGASCSAITGLPAAEASEGITAEEAEAIALMHAAAEGKGGTSQVEGKTEKIILPMMTDLTDEDAETEDQSRYVWVVYTNNPLASVAYGSDLPYEANYIAMDGEYLYSLPTVIPGDEAGASGFDSAYVFEFMEPAEYTGYVDMADGSEREISVTVMRDRRTGMYYLGNIERRIVVADCWPFLYGGGAVQLESSRDNLAWDQVGLKALYNYCRVYDYYQEIGWVGANGEGLPILILNNFCDENRVPVDNAAFVGNYLGWSIFLASQANDLSECLDVIAHEFTHCVTGTVMTYNAYANDYGAINEGMSDIQGQICELMMDPTPDAEWLMGEDAGDPVRSMSAPLNYQQPEYTWDLYYQPNVATPTTLNDQGGVHTNSSLLNRLAYLLCDEGGMSLAEARAFWFAVDCAMVPGTDYPQLRELLPWVLRTQGLDGYREALKAAMDAVRLGDDSLPGSLTEDRALLQVTLPESGIFMDGSWALQVYTVDVSGLISQAVEVLISVENGDTDQLPALLRAVLAGFDQDSEQTVTENGAGEDSESLAEDVLGELKDWVLSLVRPYLYSGMGAAGQDGRTIRMVTKGGYTLPLLMHIAFDEATQTGNEVTFVVYFNGQWIDVSDLLNAASGQEEGQEEFSLERLLEDERVQNLVGDILETVLNGEGLSGLVYQVQGGQVHELPADGLENVQLSDGTMEMQDDSESHEPRMSRPKVIESEKEMVTETLDEEENSAE